MNSTKFEKLGFKTRLFRMLRVDLRRIFVSHFLYILLAVCLLSPIAILVMTSAMDGTVTVDPQTGKESVIEGFDYVWQILGSVSSDIPAAEGTEGMSMNMSITSMCNINMLYFAMAVLVCVFTAQDFRSGFSKNLFAARARKSDYVASKTLTCTLCAALMLLCFTVGALLGGAIAGVSFAMVGFGIGNLILSLLAKLLLAAVFVPIYLVMSVIAKQRLWLSLMLSLMTGMFLFMMIPMLTPLNATPLHPFFCAAGGILFSLGIGAISRTVLNKTSLV